MAPSSSSLQRAGVWGVVALALAAGAVWALRRERPAAPPRHVLLITIDTLRADALGSYGAAGSHTPWMDRLAAAGVRFEAAYAHNVVTLPSHANILSGRHPFQHGVRDNAGFRFPAGVDTLATLLRARGYRTGAFISAFPLDSRFGLDRGFDVYEDGFIGVLGRRALLVQERQGADTVALARAWLDAPSAQPSFCWVHLYEPHFPYEAGPEGASTAERYAAEVAIADAALRPLLEPLLERRDGSTLVVLTSDHGEALGEHGEATHGVFAYEPTLRVPLLLHAPGLLSPAVVSAPARHVDLVPTILEALQAPVPAGLPGRSLLPAAGGAAGGGGDVYFEALSGMLNRGWAPLHGLVDENGVKYVDLPLPELYDLNVDPAETQNLAGARGADVARLRARLDALRAAGQPVESRAEDADAVQRLRALGYTAGRAPRPASYSEADDPKRLIALDAALQEAAARFMAGDHDAAARRTRQVLETRPGMPDAWVQLGQIERERGDLGAAVAALRRALALDPADTAAAALLGASLVQAGDARGAIAVLEPQAARAPDVDVLGALALALARGGRFEEARAALARARSADPTNAAVPVSLGTVELMAGARAAAAAAFHEALALNPQAAAASSSLAFMAAEEGRQQEALQHWRHALAADARQFDRLLALATLLVQRGRAQEARPFLELFAAQAPPAVYGAQIARVRAWLARPQPPPARAPG